MAYSTHTLKLTLLIIVLIVPIFLNITESKPLKYSRRKTEVLRNFKRTFSPTSETSWHNWAGNVVVKPEFIFRPTSVDDLKDIVKKAKEKGKKVRCAAEGHSWSSLALTKDYLIVVTNLTKVEVKQDKKYGWTATAEAGASIKQVDDALRNHDPPLTIESMTVLNSVRAAGVVATGSHGAKFEGRSIPDNVVALQIVTGDGELHEFTEENDPNEMNAARISLGLLGVIYSVTFRVVPMFNLRMIDSFPLATDWIKPENFKHIVETSDGIEIFYWPLNQGTIDNSKDVMWVKQWVKTNDKPTYTQQELAAINQSAENGTKFSKSIYDLMLLAPELTPALTGFLWKQSRKPSDAVYQAPDAIHYQAGIDNLPVENIEFSYKLDNNYTKVVDEFNYFFERLGNYSKQGKFPVMLAEIRIIKSSPLWLATTYDEDPNAVYGCIEILSYRNNPDYLEFAKEMGKRLMDKYQARPHWAKNWEPIPGIKSYLHDLLGDRILKFENVRKKYDPNNTFFDNDSLKQIFYGT
ncbi:11813_t:CDS:2 [Ambispora gerdemannii]|uniref:D-arabinono-1,4-lactone oxidase n=1 Tax=Ambispora gerdemannii TaxID=144530 RepID=A0A9N9A0T6_9GLOM|nr:11813_t:CDS:2 [Ambispora gerdemannii]